MAQVWSIVVAGGSGRRFGEMKQFSLLGGRPVLAWAVAACRPRSAGVVLVVPAAPGAPVGHDPHGADAVVTGGATRAESVRCGLAAVPAEADVIVVHDAARPLASLALFDAVIDGVESGGADGAVPGIPPSDTIKAVDESGRVTSTLDRATLVAVQTPQAFRADVFGGPTSTPRGAPPTTPCWWRLWVARCWWSRASRQLKITGPGDLQAAERLLATREG